MTWSSDLQLVIFSILGNGMASLLRVRGKVTAYHRFSIRAQNQTSASANL